MTHHTMNCTQARALLPDYSVDAVEAAVRHRVQAHLAGCAECRAELRALEAVDSLVVRHGFREPPPGLFHGVRNKIEGGQAPQVRAPWWRFVHWGPVRAAGMSLAVATLLLAVFWPVGPSVPGGNLPLHFEAGAPIASSALASSIRQHALTAAEGPLTDRVAWEAMAQLVAQDDRRNRRN
jgi:predicted anti-sigma-YlaC factor YlaD